MAIKDEQEDSQQALNFRAASNEDESEAIESEANHVVHVGDSAPESKAISPEDNATSAVFEPTPELEREYEEYVGSKTERIYLAVPFKDKDKAKALALGAKWDTEKKTWYIDTSMDLSSFENWCVVPGTSQEESPEEDSGLADAEEAMDLNSAPVPDFDELLRLYTTLPRKEAVNACPELAYVYQYEEAMEKFTKINRHRFDIGAREKYINRVRDNVLARLAKDQKIRKTPNLSVLPKKKKTQESKSKS